VTTDELLARVRAICTALPEVEEHAPPVGGSMTAFKVRGKTFAWFCDNHHGDGRIAVWYKGAPGVQLALVQSHPDRYFAPPYVGPKGWIGARVDVDGVDWEELEDLLDESYRMTAPKRKGSASA